MLALLNHFEDLMNDDFARSRKMHDPAFSPAVDVWETKQGYELIADVPGLSSEDVDVSVENGILSIAGSRAVPEAAPDVTARRVERRYGQFRRHFSLPKGVDADSIVAEVAAGQLCVKVPKPVAELPRKIRVLGRDPQLAENAS